MEIEIGHDEARSRFTVTVGGEEVGFASYRRRQGPAGEEWVFDHTVVDPAYSGRGLAGRLVADALKTAIEAGGVIVPGCSYVSAYVRRHPEYAPHVRAEDEAP